MRVSIYYLYKIGRYTLNVSYLSQYFFFLIDKFLTVHVLQEKRVELIGIGFT